MPEPIDYKLIIGYSARPPRKRMVNGSKYMVVIGGKTRVTLPEFARCLGLRVDSIRKATAHLEYGEYDFKFHCLVRIMLDRNAGRSDHPDWLDKSFPRPEESLINNLIGDQ